jgi:8-oxo-dGTP pyrophosphatase MutT (NUDIX family)
LLTTAASGMVRGFVASAEEEKSRELILALLEQTAEPFSRAQFHPGHITCTALVLDTAGRRILLMHHHRLRRWLLPGGHVEEGDASLNDTARREATEETSVRIVPAGVARLVGLDVHGIPAHPGKGEPFHLHHDLIFWMSAESDVVARSEEAPEVAWCAQDEFERYGVPASIVRAAMRVWAGGLPAIR